MSDEPVFKKKKKRNAVRQRRDSDEDSESETEETVDEVKSYVFFHYHVVFPIWLILYSPCNHCDLLVSL